MACLSVGCRRAKRTARRPRPDGSSGEAARPAVSSLLKCPVGQSLRLGTAASGTTRISGFTTLVRTAGGRRSRASRDAVSP